MLSSYELLTYIEEMDDEGAFKRDAIRGGRWTTTKQMLAESHAEQLRLRAWYLAFHSTDDNDFTFDPSDFEFVDPVLQVERAEQAEAEKALAAQTDPELAEAGW